MSLSVKQGWVKNQLDEVYWFQEGPGVRNWQFRDEGIKLLNVANVTTDGIDLSKSERFLSVEEVETKYQHFLVDTGDLIIASSGISFDTDGFLRTRGAFVRREHLPLCMNTSTIRFKSKEGISDLGFLKFWFDSFEFRNQISRFVTGSAQQNFGPSHLKSMYISLPSLLEQKRLASILAKADRLRRLRRFGLTVSDTYLQAVFLAMFGDPVTNSMGWKRATFAKLGKVQTGNTPLREDKENFGDYIEWIKSDNIVHGRMSVERSREKLSAKGLESGRYVEAGSVLLVCIAGSAVSIGNAALTDRRVAFNQQINAVTPFEDVAPWFLYGLCLVAKPLIQRSTTEGMKRIITKSKLEQLLLIKPPLLLQQKFAQIVQKHERLRAQQREAARQAEGLFQVLLHQAFRGELSEAAVV